MYISKILSNIRLPWSKILTVLGISSLSGISFWAGSFWKDLSLRKLVRSSTKKVIGTDELFVGNARSHLFALNILKPEEVHQIVSAMY